MDVLQNFLTRLDQEIDKFTGASEFEIGWFTLRQLVVGVLLFFALLMIFYFIRNSIVRALKKLAAKTHNKFDDELIKIFEGLPKFFYWVLAFYPSFKFLWETNVSITRFMSAFFIVFIVFFVTRFCQKFILYVIERSWLKDDSQAAERETAVRGVSIAINIVLWTIALLLVLVNLGIEIGPLAASLGVSSIAVAFALQNVLGDLFSSFSIYFDQPFRIGDYVDIGGGESGTVKKIGLKTTRIQSLQGEEMVVGNTQLTSATIKNYKKMRRRRVPFTVGVEYGTSSAKLKKIPAMIQKIIESTENTEFARCHFKSFGDFSLNFEIVYFVLSRDYEVYMDVQQAINLAITEQFEKEKISIAFPTQTVFVKK